MCLHLGRSWAALASKAVSHSSITFAMDKKTDMPRTLPDSFCGAGIESLCLPSDFHSIGPKACENCKRLVEVNLMCTGITVILYSTFAHCVALSDVWLPPRLTRIGKEAFLGCISGLGAGDSNRAPGHRHSCLLRLRTAGAVHAP